MEDDEVRDRLQTLGQIVIHGCRLEQYSAHILATLLKGSMAESMTVVAAHQSVSRQVDLVRQVCSIWEPGTFGTVIQEWAKAAKQAVAMRNRVIHFTDAVNPDGWFLPSRKPEGFERPAYIYDALESIKSANELATRALGEASRHRHELDPMQIPVVRDAYWAAPRPRDRRFGVALPAYLSADCRAAVTSPCRALIARRAAPITPSRWP